MKIHIYLWWDLDRKATQSISGAETKLINISPFPSDKKRSAVRRRVVPGKTTRWRSRVLTVKSPRGPWI